MVKTLRLELANLFIVLLLAVCNGCYHIPISDATVNFCTTGADNVLVCDFRTITTFAFPLAIGTCIEYHFVGGEFGGNGLIVQGFNAITINVLDLYMSMDVNSVYQTRDTETVCSFQCSCELAQGLCNAGTLNTGCNTNNLCPDATIPSQSVNCNHDGPNDSCYGKSTWCGCFDDQPFGSVYMVGDVGPIAAYAELEVNFTRDSVSTVITNIYKLGLNTLEAVSNNASVDLTLINFGIPDPGLSSQGSLVAVDTSLYVIRGFCSGTSICPVFVLGWYRSIDGAAYSWDPASYSGSVNLDLQACSGDVYTCSSDAARISTVIKTDNLVQYKLSPAYVFDTFTYSITKPHVRFNFTQPLNLLGTIVHDFNGTKSIITKSDAVIEECGSFSVCESGTSPAWFTYTAEVAGLATLNLVYTDGTGFSLGSYFLQIGKGNLTFGLPVGSNDSVTVSLSSDLQSTCSFIPECFSIVFPDIVSPTIPPSPFNTTDWVAFAITMAVVLIMVCILFSLLRGVCGK